MKNSTSSFTSSIVSLTFEEPVVADDPGRNYVMKVFGIEFTRNYWLFVIWLFISAAAYVLNQTFPENSYVEQMAIHTRNIALFLVGLYMLRKFELVKIPVQESLMEGLKQSNSPNYGYSLIALAIYYGLCISALSACIVAGL